MMKSSWSKCSGYFLNYYQIAGLRCVKTTNFQLEFASSGQKQQC